MKVLSVNIGKREKITWNGKIVETGIYKNPVDTSIFLGKEGVLDDNVIDRKYHGGKDMAVYGYAKANYAYFQQLYPTVEFTHGIFGENLTISDLDESKIHIGDTFQLGEAVVRATQPRKPCYKLGIRFGNQEIVRQFLHSPYCGVYFSVLEEGFVKKGDVLTLLKKAEDSLPMATVFSIYTANKANVELKNKILSLPHIAARFANKIR